MREAGHGEARHHAEGQGPPGLLVGFAIVFCYLFCYTGKHCALPWQALAQGHTVLAQRIEERTAAFYRDIAERQCLERDAQRAAVYDQARGDWVVVVHCAGSCSAAWGQVTVQSVEGQDTTFTLTLA